MSRNDSIDDGTLWSLILEIQAELEQTFMRATRARKLAMLADVVTPLRQMHWYAAFLGITELADLAAAGSAWAVKLQQSRRVWDVELGANFKIVLKRTRAFCDARPAEPSAGVFIDSNDAVLQGPELRRQIRVDDLLSMMHRSAKVDVNVESSCRQLAFGNDPSFSHAITIPKFATARHQEDRNLTLIRIYLDEQGKSPSEMASVFENARQDTEILLHGPLAIPWKNYKSQQGTRPYFLLLDSSVSGEAWLRERGLEGKTIRELKTATVPADTDSALTNSATGATVPAVPAVSETKVIIREVPVGGDARMYRTDGNIQEVEEIRETEKRSLKILRKQKDDDIRVRVGTKLIFIVSAILIVALSVTSLVGVLIFRDNLSTRLEMNNTSMSSVVAKQAENELLQLVSSANLLFQVGAAAGSESLVEDFFVNDPNLIYVGVPGTPYQYSSRTWFRENRIFDTELVLQGILEARNTDLEKARNGETVVVNVSPLIPNLSNPVLAIGIPFLLGNEQQPMVILTDIGDTLIESVRLQQGDASTSIVNPDGEILADRDLNRVFDGDNISGSAAYERMYTEGLDFGIIEYTETVEDLPVDYIGYFKLIDNVNLGVVTTVLRSDAYADIRTMMLLNIYFGAAIVLIGVVGIMFFARTITVPIQRLYLATRRIKAKAWETASVVPTYRDEVGSLSKNFNSMIPDLRATYNLMENTRTFINEDVAQMIYDDVLPDVANTRDVTVFFSDVRGFTSMSEAMGDPQILLDNLSQYFDAMVPCVKNTEGMVDKFIGDALMAVWGSKIEPLANHPEMAVNAALMMRERLIEFNSDRDPGDPFRPPFQIGCGLHSGPATVGVMGSTSKKEWAHMGKTVNIASRVEGVNAIEGTDILISPETAKRVDGIYHLLRTSSKYALKGIAEPTYLYAVLGRLDDPERPRTLEELRVRLGRPAKMEVKKGGAGGKIQAVTG